MKAPLLCLFLVLCGTLLSNADFILLEEKATFTIESVKSSELEVSRRVLILGPDGDHWAKINFVESDELDYEFYNVLIQSEAGNSIESFDKSNFRTTMAYTSSNSYNDKIAFHLDASQNNYPYVVEISYLREMDFLFPESWYFTSRDGKSLSSSFTLRVNPEIQVRTEIKGSDKIEVSESIDEEFMIESFSYSPKEGYYVEEYVNPRSDYYPSLMVIPLNFERAKEDGSYSSWEDYGNWLIRLWEGRQELPKEARQDLDELKAQSLSQDDLARAVYKYMQNRMRYVFLGYGQGGIQTMTAKETFEKGFGDCKALSNFTSSALNYVGIKSHVCLIAAGSNVWPVYPEIVSDYFNHVIVCMPELNDTTWLECTDQRLPFGYLSDFTDDRYGLVIKPDSSQICRTNSFDALNNRVHRKTKIKLLKNGSAEISVDGEYNNQTLNKNVFFYTELNSIKPEKAVKSATNLRSFDIQEYSCQLYPENNPELEVSFSVKSRVFARKAGTKLLFNPFLFTAPFHDIDTSHTRINPYYFKRGKVYVDEIEIDLPEELQLDISEYTDNYESEHPFGFIDYSIEQSGNTLTIKRKVGFLKGEFPASHQNDLFLFNQKIEAYNSLLYVLTAKL